MNRIKVSENFFLDEFVPEEIHDIIENEEAQLSDFQDERIPILTQWIRDRAGVSVSGNNWFNGGPLDERGVRMPNTGTGAKRSRHKFEEKDGKITRKSDAIDINIGNMTAKEMYDWAKENMNALHGLGVRTIEHYTLTTGNKETGAGWLHLDLHSRTGEHNVICIVDLDEVLEKWKIW